MTTRKKYIIASVIGALLTAGTVYLWTPTTYTVWNQAVVLTTFVIGFTTVFFIAKACNPKLNIPAAILDIISSF